MGETEPGSADSAAVLGGGGWLLRVAGAGVAEAGAPIASDRAVKAAGSAATVGGVAGDLAGDWPAGGRGPRCA